MIRPTVAGAIRFKGARDSVVPAIGRAPICLLVGLMLSSGAALFPGGARARDDSSADDFDRSRALGPEVSQAWDSPAIVRIICPGSNTIGTAFKHRSGRLLTSSSAVGTCNEVQVVLPPRRPVTAAVTAREPYSGVAIITASQPIGGRALRFAEKPIFGIGTPVASWGFPTGYESATPLVNIGYIAGVEKLQVDKDRTVTKLIVGASFNAGLSGSPLVDQSGAVVGIISGTPSILSDTSLSALRALGDQQGSSFVWQKADGTKMSLSRSQVISMVLEELQMQMTYVVGVATPLHELQDFMSKSGVDLMSDASGSR